MSSFSDFVALLRRNAAQNPKGAVEPKVKVFRPAKRRVAKDDSIESDDEFESSTAQQSNARGKKTDADQQPQVINFANAKREVMRLGESGFSFESREMAEDKRAILLGAKPRKHENENYADFLRKRAEEQVKARRAAKLQAAVRNWERDDHIRVKRRRNEKEDIKGGIGRARGGNMPFRRPDAADSRTERRKPLKRGKQVPKGKMKAARAAIRKRGGPRAFDGVPGKYMDGVQRISRKDLDSIRQRSKTRK